MFILRVTYRHKCQRPCFNVSSLGHDAEKKRAICHYLKLELEKLCMMRMCAVFFFLLIYFIIFLEHLNRRKQKYGVLFVFYVENATCFVRCSFVTGLMI